MGTNVVVAGGAAADLALLAGMGVNVVEHWSKLSDLAFKPIPDNVDLAVVVSESVSVLLVRQLEARCRKEGIPLVKTGQSWDKFSEALKDPEKFLLDDNDDMLYNLEEEKPMNKNTERAQEKLAVARMLFGQDKFAPTESVIEAIKAKFAGHGVSPSAVNKLRFDEFGVKIGPRGIYLDKKGNRINREGAAVPAQAPVTPQTADITAAFTGAQQPQAKPQVSGFDASQRLARLLVQLRTEMVANHVREITIPINGNVRAIYEATAEMAIQ